MATSDLRQKHKTKHQREQIKVKTFKEGVGRQKHFLLSLYVIIYIVPFYILVLSFCFMPKNSLRVVVRGIYNTIERFSHQLDMLKQDFPALRGF